ncbi:hypothetical protein CEXT_641581 [Caerostris extrusa]|uniref:Uncharacterized protein n=1 Tax=Caerostris extrusa TaxID=172846 RepID=A0AAV4VQA9_CAEEX|nr:hypothetical protein CEXT_641581 [Caerostris extrusa]
MFRTGTSCSGIPHYMELLMRLASFSPTKRTNRCRKGREIPHYTWSILETWSLRLESILPKRKKDIRNFPYRQMIHPFLLRSTSLNANGKDAAIQWVLLIAKRGYIVSVRIVAVIVCHWRKEFRRYA